MDIKLSELFHINFVELNVIYEQQYAAEYYCLKQEYVVL